MAVSQSLWIDRLTLGAGVRTPVVPPRVCQAVSIGNATGADLKVYSHSGEADDASHYLVIVDGFERPISVLKHLFQRGDAGLWLESTPGGLVVLIWL
jgi:hypothetical protein